MNYFNKTITRYKLKLLMFKINFNKYINYKTIFFLILITLSIGNFYLPFAFQKFTTNLSSKHTFIHFINVGQGDAILIENNNVNILIDSGPNSSSRKLITYLKKQGITKLNYVIATHPHEDHIGAMDDIINTFPIEIFIAPNIESKDIDFINLINALKSKDLKINVINNNTNINLPNENRLIFLWSNSNPDDNINNNSIVLKYTIKNISFLFTGDMENEVESILNITSKESLPSSILKIPHHGSNSSSTLNFLNTVKPYISIITCGMGNDYGHPHKDTLKNLDNINSLIYRTDINGNIIIKTDGSKVWINTEYNK